VQTVSTLALCFSLLGAPQDPTLVFVTSSNCRHCDDMKPVLARMAQEGYRIATIQGDDDMAQVRRLGVNGFPTFLLMENGREVDRVVGARPYETMVEFAQPARIGLSANPAPPRQVPQSDLAGPVPVPVPDVPPGYPPQTPQPPSGFPPGSFGGPQGAGGPMAVNPSGNPNDAIARALGATVRIKIEDDGSVSYGTGIIVDVHRTANGAEALILTCGHLFRDSKGNAALTVDFPTRQDNRPVEGKLLDYVADDADVGAIYVMLPFDVAPVPVAHDQYRSEVGQPVFSVGCDQGGDARVMQSKVTSIDRYVGPPNIQASGAPTLGRSGGGLFDMQGRLIGICNAMDPQDDEGIYAALPLIHWQLAQLGQDRLYKGELAQTPGLPVQMIGNPRGGQPLEVNTLDLRSGAPGFATQAGHAAPVAPPAQPALQATIILRDRNRPNEPARTIVIDDPTPALLQALQQQNDIRIGGAPAGMAPR
jgi:S1-C subfamily serine protease